MKTITVYHGDNGVQEFWESRDNKLVILRVKGQSYWTVLLDGKVVTDERRQTMTKSKRGVHCCVGASSANGIARILKNQGDAIVKFDKSMVWAGKPPMKLVKASS